VFAKKGGRSMSKLQEALAEASQEDIQEILAPFKSFGVTSFPTLLREFERRETFKKSRLKVEEQEQQDQQLSEARSDAYDVLKKAGVEVGEDKDSPMIKAYLALGESDQHDFVKLYLPKTKSSGGKKSPILDVNGKKEKSGDEEKEELSEGETKEIASVFPNVKEKASA